MNEKYTDISQTETEIVKSKNKILDLWSDPVISKLIANWIWYAIPIFAALVFSYFNKETLVELVKCFLLLDIKLYILLIIVLLTFCAKHLYFKFFQKSKKAKAYFINKFIGNYRFADLNNILLTTYIELPIHLNKKVRLKELDLLTCFRVYISHFNTGINWNHPTDDGVFLYYNLGPKLMSYGLCEKIPSLDNNTEDNINSYEIQTSENGYKFFALLESYDRIYNIKKYTEEIKEKQKIIDNITEK